VLSRDADFAEEPGFVPSERTIPRQILTAEALATLNQRSNLSGFLQLSGHLTILGISGSLWVMNSGAISAGNGWIAFPALVIYGFSLAAMFAPLHECVHRTAFASNRWNDLVAWFAGLLSFYNSTFYRRYHKWHHRYTQIPEKDPELSDPKPENWQEYLLELTGLFWWVGKVRGHLSLAFGKVQEYSFLPESAYAEVIRSIRLQLLVYAAAIVLSISLGHPWVILLYWILPMAIGQTILRFVLLAEHMGCTQDDNPLTNTRTTLTLAPLRFLMWNMPFHGEHHLYPSIPFHALPSAHEHLRTHIAQVIPGYMAVHRGLVAKWDRLKT
jgi:fatty acid desaturase